jgi:hypothetical protein
MIGLAAWSAGSRPARAAYATVGAFAPLPVVAFLIGGVATAGPGGLVAVGLLHAAPGAGWVTLGLARRRDPAVWTTAVNESGLAQPELVVGAGTAGG